MRVESISIKGSGEWNEDALVMCEAAGIFGVLDGATSVVPYRGPNGETGGYLAARIVKEELESIDPADWSSLHVRDAVLLANRKLREAMLQSGIDVNDKAQLWTAEIALVKSGENRVEYAQTGDCMIFAIYADGSVRVLTRDQLAHIDMQTMKRWSDCVRRGMTSRQEIRRQVEPFIRANKLKMNTPEGYAAVNGQPELEQFIEYGAINRIRLKSIIIITDGLFPHSETETERLDVERLISGMTSQGLRKYAESLIELELGDPECQRYIRFKTSDDKTAIWIRLDD